MVALGHVDQLELNIGITEQHRRRLAKLIYPGAGHLVIDETVKRVTFVAQVREADIAHRVAAGVGGRDRRQHPGKQNGQTQFQHTGNDTAILVDRKDKSPVASAAGRCRR